MPVETATRTKSRHRRCRVTSHRLALNASGSVVTVDSRSTRVVRPASGALLYNPTQAVLEAALAAGPAVELVLPQQLSSRAAVRLAGQVFDGSRDMASLGAYQVPVLTTLVVDARRVRRMLKARGEYARAVQADAASAGRRAMPPDYQRMAGRARRTVLPDYQRAVAQHMTSFHQRVYDIAICQPTDVDALLVLDAGRRLEPLFGTEKKDKLRAAIQRGLPHIVGMRLIEMAKMVSSHEEASLAVDLLVGLHSYVPPLDSSGSSISPTDYSQGNIHTLSDIHAAHVPLSSLPGAHEAALLADKAAFSHPAISQLTPYQFAALAGMLERGWALDDAVSCVLSLDASSAAGWQVCDSPPENRKELAALAAAGPPEMLRRWVASRLSVSWDHASAVMVSLGKLPPHRVQRAAASLSPVAMRDALDWAQEQEASIDFALRVVALFGKRTSQWRDKCARLNVPLHDASYWLPEVGELSPKDSAELSEYLMRQFRATSSNGLRDVKTVVSAWTQLPSSDRSRKPSELVSHLVEAGYGPLVGSRLGQSAASLRIDPARAREAAGVWAEAAGQIPWLPAGRREVGSLSVEFLDRTSGDGLFLGELTDCCQSIGSFGDSCARHGQAAPDGGFMVVRDGSGSVVAQAWCWLDADGRGVCFDNVERLESHDAGDAARRRAVTAAVIGAAGWLVEDGHEKVQLGTAMSGISMREFVPATPFQWATYRGYSDSASQVLLASASAHQPAEQPAEQLMVALRANPTLHRSDGGVCDGLTATVGSTSLVLSRSSSLMSQAIYVTDIAVQDDTGPELERLADWLAARAAPIVVTGDTDPDNSLRALLATRDVDDIPRDLSPLFGGLAAAAAGLGDVSAPLPSAVDITSRLAEVAPLPLVNSDLFQYADGDADDDDDYDYYDDYYTDDFGADYDEHRGGLVGVHELWPDASDTPYGLDMPLFSDGESRALRELECDLADLSSSRTEWSDFTAAPETETGYTNFVNFGLTRLEDSARVAELGMNAHYAAVALRVTGNLDDAIRMYTASVPLKTVYVLGTQGWSTDEVVTLWSLLDRDPDRFEIVRTLALHGLTPSGYATWCAGSWSPKVALDLYVDAHFLNMNDLDTPLSGPSRRLVGTRFRNMGHDVIDEYRSRPHASPGWRNR